MKLWNKSFTANLMLDWRLKKSCRFLWPQPSVFVVRVVDNRPTCGKLYAGHGGHRSSKHSICNQSKNQIKKTQTKSRASNRNSFHSLDYLQYLFFIIYNNRIYFKILCCNRGELLINLNTSYNRVVLVTLGLSPTPELLLKSKNSRKSASKISF